MNGRVYDYNVGRFMSVDPLIQGDGNSQGINPYSYIMNNPLSGTDPTGYAVEKESEPIKVKVTGSRIKQKVGTKTTTTISDASGKVTNVTEEIVMDNGNFAITSTNYDDNGKATSQHVVGGNLNAGTAGSVTYDKLSQEEVSQQKGDAQSGGTSQGRAVSATDSDGNAYGWRVRQISAATPEGAWGLIHGVQNTGAGYDEWVDAGGSRSAWEHPLVQMAVWVGGEALAAKLFGNLTLRSSYVRDVAALGEKATKMRLSGKSNEVIARQLHAERRELGMKYKDLTPGFLLKRIHKRNLEKYGDKLGPTIDYLRGRGRTWEDIIQSASKPDGSDLGLNWLNF